MYYPSYIAGEGMKFNRKLPLIITLFFLIIFFIYYILYFNIPSKEHVCEDCNLVIISITNLRSDHLHFNGYPRETSPNIDGFANEAIVFGDAFTHNSWTLPAGTSLLTSLYPFSHELMSRYFGKILNSNITTLIDILNSQGYNTAAFTGGFDYSPRYNVINRFSAVEDLGKKYDPQSRATFRKPLGNMPDSPFYYGELSKSVPAAIDWLEKNGDKQKFFLFAQGFDVHCPFTPPDPYDKLFDSKLFDPKTTNLDYSTCIFSYSSLEPAILNGTKVYSAHQYYFDDAKNTSLLGNVSLNEREVEHLIALYDGEIRAADESVGKLLDKINELGLSEKTIIVITSEHGDLLGENGRFMRGGPVRGTYFDAVLHIPLMIKHPNLEPKRVSGMVQLIDVMPTLLDFLNIKTNVKMDGKSLLPLIFKNQTVNEFVFAGAEFTPTVEHHFFSDSTIIVSVRNEEWKLIKEISFSPDNKTFIKEVNYELYNLKADPGENNNVFDDYKEVGKSLESKIKRQFGV